LAETHFKLFWQSGSDVPVPPRGYCLVQSIDGARLDGVAYDSDTVQADAAGNPPFWLAPVP
jgi:hypothetical protein